MRKLLLLLCALLAMLGGGAAAEGPIRIGLTPAILHDQYQAMMDLRRYLQDKTGRVIDLVPRNSYRQTIDLMKRGQLDFAWVSAFPYVYLHRNFNARLLAVPLLNGRPTFRAYLIVPASDGKTTSIAQLKGGIFAYADPYSHTGYVVPRHDLARLGFDPEKFFSRTFFTFGHKNVVRAVASHLADGGSVDSFVWDSMARTYPELTARTRIAARSAEFGGPPLVASAEASQDDFAVLRKALLGMAGDADGARLLKELNIDGFVAGDPAMYDMVERMMKETGNL